jgi:hypothetical protein
MRISKAMVLLAREYAKHGNVKMFLGDMKPVNKHHFDICDTVTEDPTERKRYGKKYLHIGEW